MEKVFGIITQIKTESLLASSGRGGGLDSAGAAAVKENSVFSFDPSRLFLSVPRPEPEETCLSQPRGLPCAHPAQAMSSLTESQAARQGATRVLWPALMARRGVRPHHFQSEVRPRREDRER
jgi:hypothetical protein